MKKEKDSVSMHVPYASRNDMVLYAALGILNIALVAIFCTFIKSVQPVFFAVAFGLLYLAEVVIIALRRASLSKIMPTKSIHGLLAEEGSVVLKNSKSPVIVFDFHGTVLWYNDAMREIFDIYSNYVGDNIASVLELTGKPKEYQKEKLESLIEEFRLQKVRKNLGDRLSGGERRRTEIARCLAIDPKFIMLDEPFAGVDPIAVEDIQYIVWKLKDKNIGILITDHNVQETLSITDRAYLLFEGRILFEGTPEVLADNPIVREKYLGRDFVLRKREFQINDRPDARQ